MTERQCQHAVMYELDDDVLAAPVGRCLGSSTARINAWEVAALGIGVGNPVSLGVYRVTGTAEDGGTIIPWSLILKVAQSPANLGLTDLGEGPDESHWNFWRREPLLFASGLLEDLPSGLTAPRFYGWSERPGNISWLWLEDVGNSRSIWSPTQYERAAFHIGRFNGVYLVEKELPSYPWLSRRSARGLVQRVRRTLPSIEDRVPDARAHPVIRFIWEADPVLDALERLPQTFCHLDAGYYNLMSRPGVSSGKVTIAIDWALAGISPVGADLSQLLVNNQKPHVFGLVENEYVLVDSYIAGLRDVGWNGSADLVRFGYMAYLACRLSSFFLFFVHRDLEQGRTLRIADTPLPALGPYVEQAQRLVRSI